MIGEEDGFVEDVYSYCDWINDGEDDLWDEDEDLELEAWLIVDLLPEKALQIIRGSGMTETQGEVFWRYIVDGLTLREIAKERGISHVSVRESFLSAVKKAERASGVGLERFIQWREALCDARCKYEGRDAPSRRGRRWTAAKPNPPR